MAFVTKDSEVVNITLDAFHNPIILPYFANDISSIRGSFQSDHFSRRRLNILLACLTDVSLSIVLHRSVLSSASKASLLMKGWSSKFDSVVTRVFVDEFFFQQ